MAPLLAALPRMWTLKGKVSSSDLGRDCFQYRFELEEDLTGVLANRPYQFCRWMVVLQRWEPIISATFPSQIPFWIRLHGLPLHYWHEQMLYNIAFDMGTLEDYSITKSAVKIRVLMDAFKPLVKEAAVDFSSGEDIVVDLDYEKLDLHCLKCNRLSHKTALCPLQVEEAPLVPPRSTPPRSSQPTTPQERSRKNNYPQPAEVTVRPTSFSQRVDRHGRPFGDRLPLPPSRGIPLRNKLTPVSRHDTNYEKRHISPPPVRQRRSQDLIIPRRSPSGKRPQQLWREKRTSSPLQDDAPIHGQSPRNLTSQTREIPPLERNLAVSDFPLLPPIPTTEQVLNELQEVTLQYTSCADPTESAARRQRVLQGEMEGLMAETAASIIAAATEKRNAVLFGSSSRGDILQIENTTLPPTAIQVLPPTGAKVTRKRGRPARKISASPKVFANAGSRRRLLSLSQVSPGRIGDLSSTSSNPPSDQGAAPRHTANGTPGNERASIPNAPRSSSRNSDFQGQGNPLP